MTDNCLTITIAAVLLCLLWKVNAAGPEGVGHALGSAVRAFEQAREAHQ